MAVDWVHDVAPHQVGCAALGAAPDARARDGTDGRDNHPVTAQPEELTPHAPSIAAMTVTQHTPRPHSWASIPETNTRDQGD